MVTNVYLDTHHISRAASGQNHLSRFFTNPSFCFFFSASHVVECLPKEPLENPDAIKRLSIIVGPHSKSLVGWGSVTEKEKSSQISDLNGLVCDRDQMLFPSFSISRAEWTKKIREGLKEVLAGQIPDRNIRRSFQAKLLRHGRLTPAAFRFLRGEIKKTSGQVSSDMPQALPLLSDGGIYDFLEGKVSEEGFTERFKETLANPVALASISTMPELSSILDFSKFFWTQMEQLAEMLSKLVNKIANAQLQNSAFEYTKIRRDIEGSLKSDEFRSSVTHYYSGVEVPSEALNRMPGTRLFVDVFSQYLLEKIDQYANPNSKEFGIAPNFKRGDTADLSHVFYCPYVHYFGCDGAMRDRIKRAGWPIKNIVTTDDELEAELTKIRCD